MGIDGRLNEFTGKGLEASEKHFCAIRSKPASGSDAALPSGNLSNLHSSLEWPAALGRECRSRAALFLTRVIIFPDCYAPYESGQIGPLNFVMEACLCHRLPGSRRQFLKTSVSAGLGVAAGISPRRRRRCPDQRPGPGRTRRPSPLPPPAAPLTPAPPARVALTTGDDRANIAFSALETFKKEIAAAIGNKRVILKPNNVIINKPLCATHADKLEGILEFLKSIGKTNVAIAESPANGSVARGLRQLRLQQVRRQVRRQARRTRQEGFETSTAWIKRDLRPHPCRISKMILDPNNFIISEAKFKTHDLVVATLSLKNIVIGAPIKDTGAGLARRRRRRPVRQAHRPRRRHPRHQLQSLCPRPETSSRTWPSSTVLKGWKAPARSTAHRSTTASASSAWTGLPPTLSPPNSWASASAKIGYLTYSAAAGMGQSDLSKIEILGPAIKDHVKSYKVPDNMDTLLSWQKPVPVGGTRRLEYRCYKRINTIRGELDTIYNSE